jgi:hypothetical protein
MKRYRNQTSHRFNSLLAFLPFGGVGVQQREFRLDLCNWAYQVTRLFEGPDGDLKIVPMGCVCVNSASTALGLTHERSIETPELLLLRVG